ncbi:YhgE/Pip domain-containing protein [Paenibacillus sp. KQZ6P-2]|uniref:YhgE/Pip domain-containing protein n=1 Tax=Paenibacillus mangrovi TaxID=2931978 RepID=A0A9X1WSI7_9BACL|nr:YhgE/Pip domain-containing protein [Paenibacillus mangrovi]MCJ8010924.1 YhgE/Pip domain-containing protein [Paenibacillus mangrovi]
MKNIALIFGKDVRNIVTNWAALVLILGLVLLPSLYAWFNIKGSWDPYSNTGGIPIAVANNDKGTTLKGNAVNLGNEIINSLKDNHNLGWRFVSEEEAIKGVQHGDYYASIIIPDSFSATIATFLTNNPTKAEILYYVNEKINAVAPKITSSGASAIVQEVSKNFVKTANGTIFKVFNELGIQLQEHLPTIEKIRSLVFRLEKSFPDINNAVKVAADDIHKTDQLVAEAQKNIALVADIAKYGQEFASGLDTFLSTASDAAKDIGPNVKQDLLLLQQTALSTQQLTSVLKDPNIDPSVVTDTLDHISSMLTSGLKVQSQLINWFDQLNKVTGNQIGFVSTKLRQVQDKMKQQQALVSSISSAVKKGEKPASDMVDRLNQISGDTSKILGDLLNRYDSEIQPAILSGLNKAQQTAKKTSSVMNSALKSIPDVKKILNDASKGLTLGTQGVSAIQKELPTAEATISDLAQRMREFETEGSLQELISLLKNNFSLESQFFAEPVVLKENKLYPIPNYGSAMSPFFSTLALWVGATLLVSLVTTEVHGDHPYKNYEVYFGRFFTFLTLALLQSVCVTTGDMFLLGTYVVDKPWFVVFGLVNSAVFMLIVYTLVSVFGNVGKALAIVLLVLQLAGAGGTFPIQTTPAFFQAIHPFLPFTYGISLMRESVGGIIWSTVRNDLLIMCIFSAVTLVIGLALKGTINQLAAGMVKKAKESKLIH